MKAFRTILLFTLFVMTNGGIIYGQTCRELCIEANKHFQAGRYERAKSLYQQVIGCGNNNYVKDCQDKIALIDGLTYKAKKAVPFGISTDSVDIPYQGGDRIVTINGSSPWTVTVNSDWCTIRKNKDNIIITGTENKGLDERTCTIVVKSAGQRRTVKVVNGGAPEMLRSSAELVSFPSEGETNIIDIYANTNWDISDVPSWLSAKREGEKIRLTAVPNEQNTERTASVKVETPLNSVIIINIYQGAGKESLSFSKNNLHFGPDGGDEYVKVYTDAEDWRLGDFPHWCQVSKVGDDMLKIHCTPNDPVDLNREASVNITTGNQTLGINISQDRKPAVAMIPIGGIGGRSFSLGFQVGFLIPMISASSGGSFTGSVVNYALGNNSEQVSYSVSGGFSVGALVDIRIYKNLYLNAGLNYLHYSYKNVFVSDAERDVTVPSPDFYIRGKIQDNFTEEYSMNQLEIPILVSYRLPVTKTSHVQFNVGPVVSIGLSAKMKFSGNSDGELLSCYKIENHEKTSKIYEGAEALPRHIKSDGEFNLYKKDVKYTETYVENNNAVVSKSQTFDASPLKKLNFGAKLGVAYEYNGINIGVEYYLMLTNMANKKYWEGNRWTVFDQTAPMLMSGYKQHNNYFQIKLGYTFRY